MKLKLKITLIALCFVVTGCTSQAGPFVTSISSDGRGGIVVEKCMVSLQRQIATMENTECTNTDITLSQGTQVGHLN
jgi:hypothetical protein